MNLPGRWVGLASSATLGVLFVTAIVVQAVAIAQSWGARYWLFGGCAAAVVCLLALVRHRHRTGTAVAGLAIAAVAVGVAHIAHLPAEPGPALALGLAVLVGSAIRALPPAPAAVVAGTALAVVAGSHLAGRPSAAGISAATVIGGVAWLAAVAVGLGLRLLDQRARATAAQVRQAERQELARELHDLVAHHITAMLVQAQAAQIVARRSPEKAAESLSGIEDAGAEALTAMRRIVGLLRDTDDAAPVAPGPEQLTALVARFNRHGPTVRLYPPDGRVPGPPEVTSTIYRIVQEALTNVSRHAPHAHGVTVTLDQDPPGHLTVEITDDAPPARLRHRGGYGLIGMRERVEVLGGTLTAGPRPAGGWCVRATLPSPAGERR
ncbi:sensor histidine kinase [Plantactinospora sp. KBS50]|uniref:sensor histidine kinase n=1 Tax=Plantactinospora sp. KBS50 TaxID=2024580 RepID=UPI000BAAD6A0|nr:sensor histidine kinase [Plantactinospora sp. KBS50]ASW56206.1 two-component sensor histidine kinase [Plantactinospora sp. KBS50]